MYRVYILLLLAIGFSAFAVDSSQSILQAKKIVDTSLVVTWTPIPEATKYKVFYDETDLLDPLSPSPLLDTDFVTKNEIELTKLLPSTEYTLIVHGYTDEGQDVGSGIPLHAKTSNVLPQMNISRDPIAINEKTIEIAFSRPIDSQKAKILLKNIDKNKTLVVQEVQSSKEDLRIISIILQNPMEMGVPYELTLKTIISLDGVELPPENRVPLKIVYLGEMPSLPAGTVPPPVIDDVEPEEKPFEEPVEIDKLPQTGPAHLIWIALFASLIVFFLQKKLSKRA